MHFILNAPRAETLILNLRDYPAWHISRTGEDMQVTPIQQRLKRPDGLIAIPVPAGLSVIDIRYAHTVDQTSGDTITLLGFVLFLLALRSSAGNQGQL
jgi:hypothetical protein